MVINLPLRARTLKKVFNVLLSLFFSVLLSRLNIFSKLMKRIIKEVAAYLTFKRISMNECWILILLQKFIYHLQLNAQLIIFPIK